MANLLSGLDSLGLGNLSKMDIFEKKKDDSKKDDVKKAAPVELKEEDYLLDKTFACPICDREFKAKQLKAGKAKRIGQDEDLRAKYSGIDVFKYDALVCPCCGYAALASFFPRPLTNVQTKLVKEKISNNFRGISEPENTLSYEDAITRYKLALVSTIVKMGKNSEKAYVCLKLAWMFRGQAETLPENTPNRETAIEALAEQEKDCLKNAFEGFMDAFSKESFPMCGMDETTVTYLCAVLAKEIGNYDESLRLLARVITSRTAKEPIKEKARVIKDEIKAITGKDQ
ncbi:MAG: DUF2225 domain-containing protein [Lachnospiraceae bacterium]|nr:DUF2225 domain-containing protein [Lachnospiraceae bacterium]